MSIQNYGKKLLADGVLVASSELLFAHDLHEISTPDFMESIVFIKAKKLHYTSALHFFWQSLFHQREVNNTTQAFEVFSHTHLYKKTYQQAKEIIKAQCPAWYKSHHLTLPKPMWTHVIWHESHDISIVFEDASHYYSWNWDCMWSPSEHEINLF